MTDWPVPLPDNFQNLARSQLDLFAEFKLHVLDFRCEVHPHGFAAEPHSHFVRFHRGSHLEPEAAQSEFAPAQFHFALCSLPFDLLHEASPAFRRGEGAFEILRRQARRET